MIKQDDRNEAEKKIYTLLVVGTDTFLSGWGRAEGGASVAAWACTSEDLPAVEKWVRARSDMKRVRVVIAKGYRPSGNVAHFHIYKVDKLHPAVGKRVYVEGRGWCYRAQVYKHNENGEVVENV